jgi:hypothetical protein
MHSVFLVKSGVTAWPASEGREDGDGEGGRAPVAAEGEEGDGEREALRTRERREAAASVGGRRGGVGGVGFLGGCCGPTGPIRAFVAGQASGASAFAVRCIISTTKSILCRALLVRRTTNQFYKIHKKYQINLKKI